MDRWRALPRGLLMLQFLAMTVLFSCFGGYRNEPAKIESDGKYYYQYLLSAWFDRDFDFADDYRVAREPFMVREIDHYGLAERLTITGRPVNLFTVGPAVLWAPFFAITYGVTSALRTLGILPPDRPSGWERVFQMSVMFAAVVYSMLTMILLFDLLVEFFSARAVSIGLLVTFWSTNWAYYCIFEPSMSHVYDLFTFVLFFWICTRWLSADRRWPWVLAGLAAGLHVLVRMQNLVTVAIVAVFLVGIQVRRRGADWSKIAFFLAALVLALMPLVAANIALFGQALAVPQNATLFDAVSGEVTTGSGFFTFRPPNLEGVLFSGRNGLFSHHPSLLLAVGGLVWIGFRWRQHTGLLLRMVLPLGLIFCAQLWINASSADWWGGHAFGQRRLISSLPFFALGFCALCELGARSRAEVRVALGGILLAAVAINLYLTGIHVFLWSYDEPHDVLHWLLVGAPEAISQRWSVR